jgi:hypothetical protein
MDVTEKSDKKRCGEKRKAPKQDKSLIFEKAQKRPWGTNGPPPPEWIEVYVLSFRLLIVVDDEREKGC